MRKVLITGGTGLVGMRLSELLTTRGYDVALLSHSKGKAGAYTTYQWDIDKGTIDDDAITTSDYIIHLAGANLADGRWTESRKKEIMDSRVKSMALLVSKLKQLDHKVKAVASSSAIGYYGNRGDNILDEGSKLGKGFLPEVCDAWEIAASHIEHIGIRLVIIRTGVVLSTKGGALPEMDKSLKFHVGAYIGDGQQYYSWIHLDDLCHLYIKAIEDDTLSGIFNGVAPNPVRQKELMQTIEKVLQVHALNAPAPSIALKLAMGEMAEMVLDSTKVSSQKIEDRGFEFEYPWLEDALKDLYERKI